MIRATRVRSGFRRPTVACQADATIPKLQSPARVDGITNKRSFEQQARKILSTIAPSPIASAQTNDAAHLLFVRDGLSLAQDVDPARTGKCERPISNGGHQRAPLGRECAGDLARADGLFRTTDRRLAEDFRVDVRFGNHRAYVCETTDEASAVPDCQAASIRGPRQKSPHTPSEAAGSHRQGRPSGVSTSAYLHRCAER